MWETILTALREHDNFLLTTHVNPDGDGFGAACALIELLGQLGKQVRLVCDSPIPQKFHFLDNHRAFHSYSDTLDLSGIEVLIVLDTHRRERIGRLVNLLDKPSMTSICIDHHEITKTFTDYTVIDTSACSVGVMIYDLFGELGIPFNLAAANGVYTSIVCDTGRFSYSNTNCKAHKVAEHCIQLGVDPDSLYSAIYQQIPLDEVRVFSQALSNLEVAFDGKLACLTLTQEACSAISQGLQLEHMDFEHLLEFSKRITGVECVALIREVSSSVVRVSLRSKGSLDVGALMRSIGGGGHDRAAGAVCIGSIPDVKDQIMGILRPNLLESTKVPS